MRSIRLLPECYRRLMEPGAYPVEVSAGLSSLQAEVEHELRERELGES